MKKIDWQQPLSMDNFVSLEEIYQNFKERLLTDIYVEYRESDKGYYGETYDPKITLQDKGY